MIDDCRAILESLALLRRGDPVHVNVTLSKNALFHLFSDSGEYFILKVADEHAIQAEFAALRELWPKLGTMAPEPLGATAFGGQSILVLRGVRHSALSHRNLERCGSTVREALFKLLEVQAGATPPARQDAPGFAGAALAALRRRRPDELDSLAVFTDERLEALSMLPAVKQHGDFLPPNLGLTPAGLIVFDWEDYGRVTMPGFDLLVFVIWMANFDAAAIFSLIERPSDALPDQLIRGFCAACRIDPAALHLLAVMSGICFFHLKRSLGYTEGISETAERYVFDYLRQPAAESRISQGFDALSARCG